MSNHRSISQLLRKNYTREKKQELALNWASAWANDQSELVRRLGSAVKNDDFDELCICVGQLKALTEKRMSALPNVINAIFDLEKMALEFERKKKEYSS